MSEEYDYSELRKYLQGQVDLGGADILLDDPWSLKPKAPKAYIDSDYILYGVGLLSEDYPEQALRIAKKYLVQTEL